MAASLKAKLALVRGFLQANGLLLLSDSELPSLAGLVTGEKIKGSWWGHPEGNLIFNVGSALGDEDDVVTSKLIGGKVTFVDRALWPALVSALSGEADWQTSKLSRGALALLADIEKHGKIQSEALLSKAKDPKSAKKDLKLLETPLLAQAHEVHTASGKHEMVYESWRSFAKSRRLGKLPDQASGMEALIRAALAFGGEEAERRLPWARSGKKRAKSP